MNTVLKVVVALLVTLGLAACNASGTSPLPKAQINQLGLSAMTPPTAQEAKLWGQNAVAACPDRPGKVRCYALIRTGPQLVPDGGSGPNGAYTPQQLEAAYNLPATSKGSGQLVAIVDAYDNPNIASDLAYYRSYFGLPPANFTKYNQEGQIGNYPAANVGWGIEEDLDVQMVSASCPNCSIALIEANGDDGSDIGAAEVEAVTLGAHIVSNSQGCRSCGLQKSDFDAPGVIYTAASGDHGYGTQDGLVPSGFDRVVDVGGTSLYVDHRTKRGFTETAWLGTGSGCEPHGKKPSWQHDPGCKTRTVNDVAALADLATGPAFYDTYGFSGWLTGGGTSTSAPFIAGVFGLAGNASSQPGPKAFWEREHQGPNDLFHIERGYNGKCHPKYLCTDGTHEYRDYGGPTGWGTPNGIGAF
jgi:subtilase family serine protease